VLKQRLRVMVSHINTEIKATLCPILGGSEETALTSTMMRPMSSGTFGLWFMLIGGGEMPLSHCFVAFTTELSAHALGAAGDRTGTLPE